MSKKKKTQVWEIGTQNKDKIKFSKKKFKNKWGHARTWQDNANRSEQNSDTIKRIKNSN